MSLTERLPAASVVSSVKNNARLRASCLSVLTACSEAATGRSFLLDSKSRSDSRVL